jgi:two-component system, NarL family, response regulator NreC
MTISIILADDHPVARRGMRVLLEAQPEFSVVGEASDGPETVRLVTRLQPVVLILDLMMPVLSGLEVLRIVRQRSTETHVVVLSMHCNTAFIAESLKNGAVGYLLKGCPEMNLVCAVREAAVGKRFLSPEVNEIAIDAYIQQSRSEPLEPHDMLTVREREILQLAAEGNTHSQIAARLNISQRTAENHRAHLMHKLGLHSHSELVRHAVRSGLIPL